VYAQAEGDYRKKVEDIANLKTRNAQGEMVPIGSMVNIKQSYGPDPVIRYNGYPAADFVGEANPALLSSAQAMDKITEIAGKVLPNGMSFEWTDLVFQEATQGTASLLVFPVAILLAFLVLAALYESWVLPLAVILIVPMCMLSALAGVKLFGGDNNTFVQVGLVVLMGLGVQERDPDRGISRASWIPGQGHRRLPRSKPAACGMRPIVDDFGGLHRRHRSAGALARCRRRGALGHGITVFAGMIGVTLFGLLLTPVFYVGLRTLSGGKLVQHGEAAWRMVEARQVLSRA